eukprot:6246139-Pyramimonas_sp.AAC.1
MSPSKQIAAMLVPVGSASMTVGRSPCSISPPGKSTRAPSGRWGRGQTGSVERRAKSSSMHSAQTFLQCSS